MATTTIPKELVQQAWAKDTWDVALNNMFFNKFTGTTVDSIVQIKNELQKQAGDKITIGLLMKLKGAGVTGDNTLEGNEEEMIFRDFSITIDQIRNGVRIGGKMEEKKTDIPLRTKAKEALANWYTEYLDGSIFKALTANPTADRTIFAGTAKSEGALTTADKFTTDIIGKAKRLAMANPTAKIRPVKINGSNMYVLIIDPWQARDLRADPKWLQAQEHANIRGNDNPIFSGALGMYEGVVVHENEQISRTATGSASAKVGHALFLGAQAAVLATGSNPTWEEDDFDYHNQYGVAMGRIMGVAKTQFKFNGSTPTDFGCINIMTASADD